MFDRPSDQFPRLAAGELLRYMTAFTHAYTLSEMIPGPLCTFNFRVPKMFCYTLYCDTE